MSLTYVVSIRYYGRKNSRETLIGAVFVVNLNTNLINVTLPGTDPAIDSYSGFFDNGKRQSTGMGEWLKEEGVAAGDEGISD